MATVVWASHLRTLILFKRGRRNRFVKHLCTDLLMLLMHLGGTVSPPWGRCYESLFPLVSLLSTYTTAHHRPPSWAKQNPEQRITNLKIIQIYTLKYVNAVKNKSNVKSRLNKVELQTMTMFLGSTTAVALRPYRSRVFGIFLP